MGKTRVLLVLLCLAAVTPVWSQTGGTEIRLSEGQTSEVRGTDLRIQAVRVMDYTSQGCEGGPRGCPDQSDLNVTRGSERQTFTLYVAHSPVQRQQAVNKKGVFGYDIVLMAIQGKSATLTVQKTAETPQKK